MTQNKIPTFKTTSLNVGDSAEILIKDVKESTKYPGTFNYYGTVNGETSYIQLSGNLRRFVPEDLASGKRSLNKTYKVTRIADRSGVSNATGKTFVSTNFLMVDKDSAPTAAPQNTSAGSANVADKLAAIRARRAQNEAK
jgi:hypothetical protein